MMLLLSCGWAPLVSTQTLALDQAFEYKHEQGRKEREAQGRRKKTKKKKKKKAVAAAAIFACLHRPAARADRRPNEDGNAWNGALAKASLESGNSGPFPSLPPSLPLPLPLPRSRFGGSGV